MPSIKPPLIAVELENPMLGEVIDLEETKAIVIAAYENKALALLFDYYTGEIKQINRQGNTYKIAVSEDYIGGIFNGFGEPIKGPKPYPEDYRDINGLAINPYARKVPNEILYTGISSIDVAHPLLKGQKIAIFSPPGLPMERLALQIARNVAKDKTIIFAAIGVPSDIYKMFIDEFINTKAIMNSAIFISKADSSPIEKIYTPRVALTLAEYLAFEKNRDVLVLMLDMTNYADALREISTLRKEIPSRRGYPAYLYTDLASIYERSGLTSKGSITLIPMLTMPGNDITHVVPDLTGYITEGQYVLSQDLHSKNIYPPIDLLKSLSRLAKKYADILIKSYAKGLEARDIATIVGEDSLSKEDKAYLKFAELVEKEFIKQDYYEYRSIEKSFEIIDSILSQSGLPYSPIQ